MTEVFVQALREGIGTDDAPDVEARLQYLFGAALARRYVKAGRILWVGCCGEPHYTLEGEALYEGIRRVGEFCNFHDRDIRGSSLKKMKLGDLVMHDPHVTIQDRLHYLDKADKNKLLSAAEMKLIVDGQVEITAPKPTWGYRKKVTGYLRTMLVIWGKPPSPLPDKDTSADDRMSFVDLPGVVDSLHDKSGRKLSDMIESSSRWLSAGKELAISGEEPPEPPSMQAARVDGLALMHPASAS